MLKSKIVKAIITQSGYSNDWSITLDKKLMDAADIFQFEKVHVVNVNNGNKLETYALEGTRDSGEICINGSLDHFGKTGDEVVITTYSRLDAQGSKKHKPTVVIVDKLNKITKVI